MEEQINNVQNSNLREGLETNKIAGAIVLAGLIIAGAVLLKGSTPPKVSNTGNTGEPTRFLGRPISSSDHIIGNPNGRIVILEYSDLECPFCRVFHGTMHRIIKENNDVAWVYRHYPIPQLHAKATREAEASECAWAQGGNTAFWKYIDRVFEITPSNDGLADAQLPQIAQYIGLDVTAFNNCLANGKYTKKVQDDVADGEAMSVNGTPSSFILVGGELVDTISGAQPYETIVRKLNALK